MHLTTDGVRLKAATILDMVSVGATINTMLAAGKAEGRTIIENAAENLKYRCCNLVE